MNYYDERFIKCPNCHVGLIVYPGNKKWFKCYKCGTKIRDKEYINRKKEYNETHNFNGYAK